MAAPTTPFRRLAAAALALVAPAALLVLTGFPVEPSGAAEALAPASAPAPATVQYGAAPHQVMDLRRPDAAAFPGPRPVVLFVHAGGWISGDRTGLPEAALVQVARGFAVASIDYQLAAADADGRAIPSFPAAVWDVKRAVRFLKANAGAWSLDPGRIVLMGASAGGHLAAMVGARRVASWNLRKPNRHPGRSGTRRCGAWSTWSAPPIWPPSSTPTTPGRPR